MSAPDKCDSAKCAEPATAAVYWPGRDPAPRMCTTCAERATRIANVMGFALVVEHDAAAAALLPSRTAP